MKQLKNYEKKEINIKFTFTEVKQLSNILFDITGEYGNKCIELEKEGDEESAKKAKAELGAAIELLKKIKKIENKMFLEAKNNLIEQINKKRICIDTAWVKEHDFDIYKFLRDWVHTWAYDPYNNKFTTTDLEDYENGKWVIIYDFNYDEKNNRIIIHLRTGKTRQRAENLPALETLKESPDGFLREYPHEKYLEIEAGK